MIFYYSDGQDGSESGNESAASVKSGLGSDAGSSLPWLLAPSNSFNARLQEALMKRPQQKLTRTSLYLKFWKGWIMDFFLQNIL